MARIGPKKGPEWALFGANIPDPRAILAPENPQIFQKSGNPEIWRFSRSKSGTSPWKSQIFQDPRDLVNSEIPENPNFWPPNLPSKSKMVIFGATHFPDDGKNPSSRFWPPKWPKTFISKSFWAPKWPFSPKTTLFWSKNAGAKSLGSKMTPFSAIFGPQKFSSALLHTKKIFTNQKLKISVAPT